ncbi:hypothetical protein BDB01DRAFT_837427 [Pilobolus umbonatus]|nr:hypothetical protein BDB01DRAFT_837427 [Pilobolus umbonatus]
MFMLILLFVYFSLAACEVISPSHNYNVTLPEVNAPYVAGQMLPISYTLPDDTSLSNSLSLSIYFTTQDPSLNFTEIVITSNADISQGFSFRRTHNTYIYYEHQLSYALPNSTLPGTYVVQFVDSVSRTNTTIPIIVRPYAAPVTSLNSMTSKSRPTGGSIFAMTSNEHSIHPLSGLLMISMMTVAILC